MRPRSARRPPPLTRARELSNLCSMRRSRPRQTMSCSAWRAGMTEVSTTAVSTNATRKAALWVGVVFLLGAALGGVLGYLFAHHPVIAANPPLSEPERRAQKLQELTKELSLTSQQAQQVDSILMQRH